MIFSEEPKNNGRSIGYARVSTKDQKLDLQIDALKAKGCTFIFSDHGISGRKASRPGFDKLMKTLKSGDTLYVYKISRLGRSSMHLAKLLKYFIEEDIAFCSLSEGINITTSSGKLMYHMIAGFAEFDADIISENTISGLQAAKARGQHLGRPYKLTPKKITQARHLINVEGVPILLVARNFKVSQITLERALKRFLDKCGPH